MNNFDLRSCSLENVELLQKMMPTEQETKSFKEFIVDKRDVNQLTDEDKMLLQLTKVERLSAKLTIMSYIANFVDVVHQIGPVSTFACLIKVLLVINFRIYSKYIP